MDMQHSTYIESLDVDGLLAAWPGIGSDARKVMQVSISKKLKSSAADFKSKLVKILRVSSENIEHSQAFSSNHSPNLSQDTDSNRIITAFALWIPAFFMENAAVAKSLFKELADVYCSLVTSSGSSSSGRLDLPPNPVEALFNSCIDALKLCEFQNAEQRFGVLIEFCRELERNLQT